MKIKSSLAILLVLLQLVGTTQAQTPSRSTQETRRQQQGTPAEDEVVRITTNLVQVDAVVTDKSGRPVTDLQPEEFEILEDGQPQRITNFSYVETDRTASAPPTPTVAAATTPAAKTKGTPPVPPVRLRPEQVRRTVALVVDDFCMSITSARAAHLALKKFVDEQMQPGDLVAIFRTRGGSGTLQQFTSDKQQLYQAINNVRWYPSPIGFNCRDNFETARADYTIHVPGSTGGNVFEDELARKSRERLEDINRENLTVGTLGTLRFVVQGLNELPGRKSVVLISDGMPIFSRTGSSDRTLDALRRLVDLANRASVVVYTMDARGLISPDAINAGDEVLPFTGDGAAGNDVEKLRQQRNASFNESQNGLSYLAEATGGLFIHNTNYLENGLRRVLEDQRGYYLIGYRPSEATFAKGVDKFRKVTVRVKRPDLLVRSRSGFYSMTDEAAHPKPRSGDSQLYAALASPLNVGGVRVRLTSLFGDDPHAGSFMRSLLHIDARDLTFTDEAGGWKKLVLDVAAVTFGENGKLVDEFNRTHTVRIGHDTFQQVLQNGLAYSADVPVKKPGSYQLRIVVRDNASKRLGSASQFIEVPDLKSGDLALSGIVLSQAEPNNAGGLPPRVAAEAALAPVQSPSNLAVRTFRPGSLLSYSYLIYNGKTDRANTRPRLTTQVRLFREGQPVLESQEVPFDPEQQTDFARLSDQGFFKISETAQPGEYVLQLIVNDTLAPNKRRTATRWIDFEVISDR